MQNVYFEDEIKKNEICVQYTVGNYSVRERTTDYDTRIEDFFYDTFYVPEELEPLPREILSLPCYQKYFRNLGYKEGDFCFEAYDTLTNDIVGVVWTRIINEECSTPFLLISVSASYRGKGIGSSLLFHILSELRSGGYTKVILSVHKQNRAVALYERCGFSIYDSDEECYKMVNFLE